MFTYTGTVTELPSTGTFGEIVTYKGEQYIWWASTWVNVDMTFNLTPSDSYIVEGVLYVR